MELEELKRSQSTASVVFCVESIHGQPHRRKTTLWICEFVKPWIIKIHSEKEKKISDVQSVNRERLCETLASGVKQRSEEVGAIN
ncbi:hypothetical protein TNCV_3263871 [Trichonephila clavipes]|nr:hypothetical protein TNCV_3263871 [Trichonephila clavipes]